MSIRLTIRGNRHLADTVRRKIERKILLAQDELVEATRDIARTWAGRINIQTGTLVRSLTLYRLSPRRTRLEITAPHAFSVEKGARPHVIEARDGGVLRWRGRDGTIHFAKRVNHPGNPPGNQLRDAVAVIRRTLGPRIQRILRTP